MRKWNRMLRSLRGRDSAPATADTVLRNGPAADEIIGLDHPSMTPDLAAKLLKDGVPIPYALLRRIGPLCDPMRYRVIPNGELMAIADELNGALDRALKLRQETNLKSVGKARPFEDVKEVPKQPSTHAENESSHDVVQPL
jgi:hypothetical protein